MTMHARTLSAGASVRYSHRRIMLSPMSSLRAFKRWGRSKVIVATPSFNENLMSLRLRGGSSSSSPRWWLGPCGLLVLGPPVVMVVMWRGRHRSNEEEARVIGRRRQHKKALALAVAVAEGSMVCLVWSVIVEGVGRLNKKERGTCDQEASVQQALVHRDLPSTGWQAPAFVLVPWWDKRVSCALSNCLLAVLDTVPCIIHVCCRCCGQAFI